MTHTATQIIRHRGKTVTLVGRGDTKALALRDLTKRVRNEAKNNSYQAGHVTMGEEA